MSKIEELKQLKTDDELSAKCNEIIDSLRKFNCIEKYRILTTLYESFMDICKQEGIAFLNIEKLPKKEE